MSKDFKGIRKVFLRIIKKKTILLLRAWYQTIASAVMVIKAPKTAVNPNKTIR
jgi:hypothetical protein